MWKCPDCAAMISNGGRCCGKLGPPAMTPSLLCEMLAALMYEYLDRASCALADHIPLAEVTPRHFFDTVLLPAWMDLLLELDLPLEPPAHDKVDERLRQLADYLRKSAQDAAVQKEFDDEAAIREIEDAFEDPDHLPPARGTFN